VFALVPKLSLEGEFLAGVKACGLGAALSHFSAAVLRGWFRWDGRFPEVTATNPRRHEGIYTHRSNKIERTFYNGIPVTPVLRTLTDLSSMLPFAGTRRAVNEALNQRQIKPAELVTSHHRGAKTLRAILATAAPTTSTANMRSRRTATPSSARPGPRSRVGHTRWWPVCGRR
jgi:hypothetical protein